MDLIYLYIGGSRKKTSVQQKVVCQIHQLNKNGISAKGFFYSKEIIYEEKLDEFITLKPLPAYKKKHRFFHSRIKSAFEANYIFNELKAINFNTLYVRYGLTSLNMFRLLSYFSSKTILYIPSNIISEPFQEKKANKYHSVFSWMIKWIDYFIFSYILNYYLYLFVIPKLKATVAFTPEFASIIKRKSLNRAKVIYNRDGADILSIKPRNYVLSHDTYKLIFLKGSSVQQPWAGLDRLAKSIAARPDLKIELYITGKVFDDEFCNYPFVKLTGRLTEEELENLISTVDIGVSNLANYLIGFNETTNLKSRDYYARGLPFIQANTMPDVEGCSASKYYLNIENSNSLIDMDKVKNFILNIRLDKNHVTEMRRFAEEWLDWKHTVKELAESIKSIN